MKTKSLKTKKALAYLQANPSAKASEVAKKFNMTLSYVYVLKSKSKKPSKIIKTSTKKEVVDNVNHPPHYKVGGIETIDFIEAKKLNYNLGNVVKYITRADHKGSRNEDLKKALWYLNRELGRKA
jgi:hypothetical protein